MRTIFVPFGMDVKEHMTLKTGVILVKKDVLDVVENIAL